MWNCPSSCGAGTLSCGDSCHFAADGDCDDGGPGSEFGSCTLGADCADCGERGGDAYSGGTYNGGTYYAGMYGSYGYGDAVPPPTNQTAPPASCSETCQYAADGGCDDGGPGSAFSLCTLGSDCSDCGNRNDGS